MKIESEEDRITDEVVRDIIQPPHEIKYPGGGTPLWLDIVTGISLLITLLFVILLAML